MSEYVSVLVSPELLRDVGNFEALKINIRHRLIDALERELFDGLTLAEYEEQLLNGTGEGVPVGIIRAETK